MYRILIFVIACCFWQPAFADDANKPVSDSVFVDNEAVGDLKPEFRVCSTDNDCTFTDVVGCIDRMPVNVVSKARVSAKLAHMDAADSCITPPDKNKLPANPVRCLSKLCEWGTANPPPASAPASAAAASAPTMHAPAMPFMPPAPAPTSAPATN